MARIAVHTLILPVLVYLLARQQTDTVVDTAPAEEYDYIIVGGGTAGCLLANRLSQDPSISVLLIEAGDKDNVTTEVPALAAMLQESDYDWKYRMTEQESACLANIDQKCNSAAGKVIGGSSSISFMVENRGPRQGFTKWKMVDEEWSFDKLLPYFKRHEDDRTKGECKESTYHSCNGELTFTRSKAKPPVSLAFVKSLTGNGFQEIDFQTGNTASKMFSKVNHPVRNGIRSSSANAFLKPVQHRPNLHVSLNTLVTKVLIDPETKEATGVELEREGEPAPREVRATKEVILSAGALRSPQLLMLSGIGPREVLERFHIPVIADLPGVGQNYQDTVASFLVLKANRSLNKEELEMLGKSSITQWAKGTGPMTIPLTSDVIAAMTSSGADNELPDIGVVLQSIPILSIGAHFFKLLTRLNDKTWEEVFEPLVDQPIAIVHTSLLNPSSKGYVTIKSSDPHQHPEINPRLLSNESDVHKIANAMKQVVKIGNHEAFKEIGYAPVHINLSECRSLQPFSTEYYHCLVRHVTLPMWLYCCTNKMGIDTDPYAVVDKRLRVRGVKKLRVVDASIMPGYTRGLLLSTVYVIAEKASDMIKEDN